MEVGKDKGHVRMAGMSALRKPSECSRVAALLLLSDALREWPSDTPMASLSLRPPPCQVWLAGCYDSPDSVQVPGSVYLMGSCCLSRQFL